MGDNFNALTELVAGLVDPHAALVALAGTLAAAIDANPEQGLAPLVKEYRACLKELAAGGGPDVFAALLAEMGNAT